MRLNLSLVRSSSKSQQLGKREMWPFLWLTWWWCFCLCLDVLMEGSCFCFNPLSGFILDTFSKETITWVHKENSYLDMSKRTLLAFFFSKALSGPNFHASFSSIQRISFVSKFILDFRTIMQFCCILISIDHWPQFIILSLRK